MSILFSTVLGIFSLYAIYMLFFLFGLFKLRRRPSVFTVIEPNVSIIIAARNEEDNIGNLLADLTKQTYNNKKLEIVIVDDRSTDNTWEIIDHFKKNFQNIYGIRIDKKSKKMTPKKHALTQAIGASTGEIIISTDADCRVPSSWVNSIVKQFDKETGIVIGYSQINIETTSLLENYQKIDFLALMCANAGPLGWGSAWTGSGQNIAYRREAFNKINGFKPVADQVSGDDFYLVQEISKIAKARFNPNPTGFVKTQSMKNILTFISQRTRWASNTRKLFNTDFFFLLFLFLNLFVNTILLGVLFFKSAWVFLPQLFGIKILFDSMLIFYGSKLFKTPVNIGVYILWSACQPLYTPILAVLSMLGKYRWKE